jgi:hypothetical protein
VSGKSGEGIESYIFHALSGKTEDIMNALRAKSPIRLTWTHYRIILQESSKEARDAYQGGIASRNRTAETILLDAAR